MLLIPGNGPRNHKFSNLGPKEAIFPESATFSRKTNFLILIFQGQTIRNKKKINGNMLIRYDLRPLKMQFLKFQTEKVTPIQRNFGSFDFVKLNIEHNMN